MKVLVHTESVGLLRSLDDFLVLDTTVGTTSITDTMREFLCFTRRTLHGDDILDLLDIVLATAIGTTARLALFRDCHNGDLVGKMRLYMVI